MISVAPVNSMSFTYSDRVCLANIKVVFVWTSNIWNLAILSSLNTALIEAHLRTRLLGEPKPPSSFVVMDNMSII